MAVIHAKVSAKSDGADTTLVQPSDWNAGHTINDIIPAADSTYKLGASGTAWTAVYTEVVSFPATQVPSAGANDLDDYEEGSVSPVGNGITFTAADGRYTKIGRLVHVEIDVTWPTTSDAGEARIGGLPFTVAFGAPAVIGYKTLTTAMFAEAVAANTYIAMLSTTGATQANSVFSTHTYHISVTYTV